MRYSRVSVRMNKELSATAGVASVISSSEFWRISVYSPAGLTTMVVPSSSKK